MFWTSLAHYQGVQLYKSIISNMQNNTEVTSLSVGLYSQPDRLLQFLFKLHTGNFRVILHTGDDRFCTAILPDYGPVRAETCRSFLKY